MNIIVKYLISGGTAAVVSLVSLNYLDSLGLHYLISVNIAFIFAFFVSFSLQKYWTFNDAKVSKTHHQMMIYFVITFSNLFLNSLIVHLLMTWNIVPHDFVFRQVVWAQIVASAFIAIESFIIYRYLIFKKDTIKKVHLYTKPNILIVTPKVDIKDAAFEFFIDWLNQFSKNCTKITVIGLEVGEYKLPENIKVFSLKKSSKIKSLLLLWKYSIAGRRNYDVVFCHMSPLFVISGWPVWKLFDKKITLWYVHRSVDLKLRLALMLSDMVFTATPESFRIKSDKVRCMGQAVDLNKNSRPSNFVKKEDEVLKIVTVGRITKIKNLDLLVRALAIVKSNNIPLELSIVGDTVTHADEDYKKELDNLIVEKGLDKNVKFLGLIPNKDLPKYHMESDVAVNLAPTGGLDKTVLEAMATETPTVVFNKAFAGHLGLYVTDLLAKEGDEKDFADKLVKLYKDKNYAVIGKALRNEVEKRSSLDNLISSIIKNINEIQ
jgi:glycosyltransferase involved in cell wall biosynthesis